MQVERCVSKHSFERRSRIVDDVTDDDEVGNEMRRNVVNWNSMRRILTCYFIMRRCDLCWFVFYFDACVY